MVFEGRPFLTGAIYQDTLAVSCVGKGIVKKLIFIGFWLVFCLEIFKISVCPLYADETLSAQLSFVPYSSSFLPLHGGYLTHRMNPEEKKSTMERFDEARLKILGINDPLYDRVEQTHYLFDADGGAGFCHQWSAASLNIDIERRLSSTEGISCDEVLITQGELKELFTGLYEVPLAEFYGNITRKAEVGAIIEIKNKIGLDDLPAHIFHQELYDYLNRDQGVVLDIRSNEYTSNQPVFRAVSSVHNLSSPELMEYIEKIPLKFFKSDSELIQQKFEEIKNIETLLSHAVLESFDDDAIEKAWEPYGNFFKEIFYDHYQKLSDLINVRAEMIGDVVMSGLQKGTIHFNSEISFKDVITYVEMADYNQDYASSINHTKEIGLEYILIEQNSEVIDSVWISDVKFRADYMWIPPVFDVYAEKNPSDTPYQMAVKDLMTLMGKCQDVSEILDGSQNAKRL